MENIKKQRKHLRTQTTKLLGKEEGIRKSEDLIKLQVLKEQLQEKRTELKDLDKEFVILAIDTDEEVEKDSDTSEEYQEKILEAIKRIELNLKERERDKKKIEE